MRIALLHRRLSAGMALAALVAFGAGAGVSPLVAVAGAGLALSLYRLPPPEWGAWVERGVRVGVLALFAWAAYVAFVVVGDFMPPVLAMLLFLLVGENLRPLASRSDLRLYALSFALMIAATAYYPGLLFAGAFVAYVALASLALMVGHLRREAERFRVAEVRVGRSFLTATAALSGFAVLVSAVLFVLFPRLPRQWNVRGRPAAESVMAGFSETVTLADHGGRISSNPEVAFRVEFPEGVRPDPATLYWRGRSYDRFDGLRWSRSRGVPPVSPSPAEYRERWGGPPRSYRIFGGPPGARILFGLHPLLEVSPRSAIRPRLDSTGDLPYHGTDSPLYGALSAAPLPPEEALRSAPEGPAPGGGLYLQLPPLSPRVDRLADSLTAGLPTRHARVRAVERWLREELRYTLELPATAAETGVEHFLFRRREGHCEYFSTGMVVLLRSAGIPARNVNGFLGGEWNGFGNYLAVTGNEAHSWVEVWFPELGWVPFDPTPARSRELRAGVVEDAWGWSAFLWMDGLQHRWYKWVVDYNLEKQLDVFRRVGSVFDRGGVQAPSARDRGVPLRQVVPWVVGAGVLLLLLRGVRGRRALSPEAARYLALRRAYARAGFPEGAEPPLEWLERLRRAGAPGVEQAGRVVELYLRARFGGEEIGPAGRAEMAESLAGARGALRRGRGQGRRSPPAPPVRV